jgi:hypothetical protein
MVSTSISAKLDRYRSTLSALVNDPALREGAANFGYDAAEVAVGQSLYDQVLQARNAIFDAQSNQLRATDQLKEVRQNLRVAISDISKVLEIEFGNDRGVMERLSLRPERRGVNSNSKTASVVRRVSRRQHDLLDQGRTLFAALQDETLVLERLNRIGYTSERLQNHAALVQSLENLDSEQELLKVETRVQTAAQKQALQNLEAWIKRLFRLARIAFRDQPHLLRKLQASA